MKNFWSLLIFLSLSIAHIFSNEYTASLDIDEDIEGVVSKMSLQEKVWQLLVPSVSLIQPTEKIAELKECINKGCGGVLLLHPWTKQAASKMVNDLSKVAQSFPLFFMLDAEWKTQRIIDGGETIYPKIQGKQYSDEEIEQYAYEIGILLKSIGIHVNLAPVIEFGSPEHRLMGKRMFGTTPEDAIRGGLAYLRGLKRAGISACAKHFPGGHALAVADPHHQAVIAELTNDQIEAALAPFISLINNDVPLIMTGHLIVPQLDSLPGTLSYKVTTELLKDKLGFKGLVITDSLTMKAVTGLDESDPIAIQAFKAGADILLRPQNPKKVAQELIQAFESGELPIEELDNRVRKILTYKKNYFTEIGSNFSPAL